MSFGAVPSRSSNAPLPAAGADLSPAGVLAYCLGAGAQVVVLMQVLGGWNSVALTPGALVYQLLAALVLAVLPARHWLRMVRTAGVDGGIAPATAEALGAVAPLLGTIVLACYWLGHCALAAFGLALAVTGLQELPGAGLSKLPAPLLALGLLAITLLPAGPRLRSLAPVTAAIAALAALAWMAGHQLPLLPPGLPLGESWFGADPFTRVGAWCAGVFLAGPSLCAYEAVLSLPSGRARRNAGGRWLVVLALSSTIAVLAMALGGRPAAIPVAISTASRLAESVLALSAGVLACGLSRRAALRAVAALAAGGRATAPAQAGQRAAGVSLAALLTGTGVFGFLLLRDTPWLFAGAGLAYFMALTGVAAVAQNPARGVAGLFRLRGVPPAALAALAWPVCGLLGLQAWGVRAVLVGLAMVYGGGLLHLAREFGSGRARGSVHDKLLGSMLLILGLNGAGYLIAQQALIGQDRSLAALIDDIFTAVALLTLLVGVVLPAMVVHALTRAAEAAERLTNGPVSGLRDGIDALGRGELDGLPVEVPSERLETPFRDEIGRIAASINSLQDDVQQAARGLDSARENLRRSRAELFHQARHDSLTGLHNRRAFEETLAKLVSDRRTGGPGHALLYLDLDQFKIVNDTCGHDAGDELLRQVSLVLGGQMRGDDVLSRLGGDEFGVILANCAKDNAIRIGEAMVVAVRELSFGWRDRVFRIGVSIGLVHFLPATTTLTDVLSAADKACYFAKEQGRNRLHAYSPDDDEITTRSGEMQWVSRIHEALEEGRMCLYAQEIRSLAGSGDGARHHEVLLRMVDRGGELVPPMAFIPAAERFGVMTMLDRWVVRTAFERLGALVRSGEAQGFGSLAINLSGTSITDEAFLEFVKEQFQLSRVPYQRIWFEITETSAIANLRRAKRFISELRALGCRFGLDDFGAGMSSFGYLRQLEVDFLKIDGAFVQDMVEDPIDRAMVDSINRIGQLMGLSTIAEFVADQGTIELLRGMGVDMIQGNGVSLPVPFVQAEQRQHARSSAAREPGTTA